MKRAIAILVSMLAVAAMALAQTAQPSKPQPKSKSAPATTTAKPKPAPAPAPDSSTSQPAGQAPNAAPAMNMMPAPAPEMKKLTDSLKGHWMVEERFEVSPMMPNGGQGRGMEMLRPGPGGLSLVSTYRSMEGVMNGFSGEGIINWSPEEKIFKLYWVDSMDPAGSLSQGRWEGENLVFDSKMNMAGKPMVMRQTISGIKPDSYTVQFEMSPEGAPLARFMTFQYTRAKGPMMGGPGMMRRHGMMGDHPGMGKDEHAPPPPPPAQKEAPKQEPPK